MYSLECKHEHIIPYSRVIPSRLSLLPHHPFSLSTNRFHPYHPPLTIQSSYPLSFTKAKLPYPRLTCFLIHPPFQYQPSLHLHTMCVQPETAGYVLQKNIDLFQYLKCEADYTLGKLQPINEIALLPRRKESTVQHRLYSVSCCMVSRSTLVFRFSM